MSNWRWLADNWLALVVLVGLVAAWFFLRTSPTRLGSAEEFHQRVRSGRPAVVEFFSNA